MAKLIYDYWFIQFGLPRWNCKPYKSGGGKMVWCDQLKREILSPGWTGGPPALNDTRLRNIKTMGQSTAGAHPSIRMDGECYSIQGARPTSVGFFSETVRPNTPTEPLLDWQKKGGHSLECPRPPVWRYENIKANSKIAAIGAAGSRALNRRQWLRWLFCFIVMEILSGWSSNRRHTQGTTFWFSIQQKGTIHSLKVAYPSRPRPLEGGGFRNTLVSPYGIKWIFHSR